MREEGDSVQCKKSVRLGRGMEEKREHWWIDSVEEVCRKWKSNVHRGLEKAEAIRRRQRDGFNQLQEPKSSSLFMLFATQFSSIIVWLLLAAVFVSVLLGQWVDATAIFVIVVLNAIIGCVQEFHAVHSLAALRKLTAPHSTVMRSGEVQMIAAKEIVSGDLVILEAGDCIPADGRIVESRQLFTQESALTGESVSVHKEIYPLHEENLPVSERKNCAFMGTVVASGRGKMVVTATGRHTELGKIATLIEEEEKEKTPLQQRLDRFGKNLVYLCLVIVAAVFLLGLWRGESPKELILFSLSLAVAAIPEGLPAILTVVLGVGVRRMAHRGCLVRRLASVETLGCSQVICSDKTGTLTQNEMKVVALWSSGKEIFVNGMKSDFEGIFLDRDAVIDPNKIVELEKLLLIAVFCNNAHLIGAKSGWKGIGDATDAALLVAAAKAKILREERSQEYRYEDEIPFDSDRKRMSVVIAKHRERLLFTKGAVELLLALCTHVEWEGKRELLQEERRRQLLEANEGMAKRGLRVLGFAYRELQDQEEIDLSLEQELTFVGMCGLADPPREEAKEALASCRDAGIKAVMVTGDHKETSLYVAREIDLLEEDSLVITGQEMDQMEDKSLLALLPKIALFCRTTAEQKLRIVELWKELGKVVAVTGDGVNDAPAIKKADIGVAMGITGTEVAKESADMVITDDHFASIVHGVEEGRVIYENIVKFLHYLLSSNLAELFIIFAALFFGFKDQEGTLFIPLTAVQLLWLNLVTDGLPAISLGMDPVNPGAMKKQPRSRSDSLISLRLSGQLFCSALLMAIGAIAAAYYGLQKGIALGQTMTLTAIVVFKLVKVQSVRAQYQMRFFSNRWVLFALASSFFMQLVILYTPGLQSVFGTVALQIDEWFFLLFAGFLIWILDKAVVRIFPCK